MSTLDQIIGDLPAGEPFEIVLTEPELTALAGDYARSHPALGLSDVAVHLTEGSIEVAGKTKMVGLAMDVRIVGGATLLEGKVVLEVAKLELNGAAAPGFLKNQIVNAFSDQFDPDNLPIRLESLQIRQEGVRVTGTKK